MFLSSSTYPEIHGFLHAKEQGKKSWKKIYFLLRRSGLYFSTKGTSKVIEISVVCYESYISCKLKWILLYLLRYYLMSEVGNFFEFQTFAIICLKTIQLYLPLFSTYVV